VPHRRASVPSTPTAAGELLKPAIRRCLVFARRQRFRGGHLGHDFVRADQQFTTRSIAARPQRGNTESQRARREVSRKSDLAGAVGNDKIFDQSVFKQFLFFGLGFLSVLFSHLLGDATWEQVDQGLPRLRIKRKLIAMSAHR
jgi:hypothetical protein